MNTYQQQNPNCFQELEDLVNTKPHGFTQMLEAKGRRREPNSIPKYKHLFDWLNGVLPEIAQHLATKELFIDNDDDVRKAIDEFKMRHPTVEVVFYQN